MPTDSRKRSPAAAESRQSPAPAISPSSTSRTRSPPRLWAGWRRICNNMIKRFHALYVGQIALDNIGLDGTPANDRRYSNARLSEVFWTARDVARLMDELGYYCFWTAEHHFQREGYECLPNLIQLGLWLD